MNVGLAEMKRERNALRGRVARLEAQLAALEANAIGVADEKVTSDE
jgi:hypothetical protein